MRKLLVTAVVCYLAYLIFATSCANPGVPVGGDKDTIAPVVLKTLPAMNAVNFKGKAVNITFDEFIVSTDVGEALVVSPPMKKKPLIRTKSKTLIVDFSDQQKPNTSYSLDFKNSIADNNEKNPLPNFRMSFSTGPVLDSLMLGGYVRMAENMEPVKDVTILLHRNDSLKAFRDSIPDYIARTDSVGFFKLTNLAAGAYRMYALMDADNSLTFNSTDELIAFSDSLVVPEVPLLPDSTLLNHSVQQADSLQPEQKQPDKLVQPELVPHYLLLFEEPSYKQFLESSKRERANLCTIIFDESLTDSFRLNLLSPTPTPDWALLEFSPKRDTLNVWVRDTALSQVDTLKMALSFEVLDSLQQMVLQTDTVDFFYSKPEVKEKRKKKDEEKEEKKTPNFSFRGNGKDGFDVYSKFLLEVPEPLESFDFSKIHLSQKVDTLWEKREFEVEADSSSLCKYRILHRWDFEEEYQIEIDSAAAYSISTFPSGPFKQRLKVKEEGYYAKIILTISKLYGPSFVQLLKNTDKEEVVQQIAVEKDGAIEFPYLAPEKFKIRLVIDPNRNGEWETGNIEKGLQPERVVYYPKILKMRSNFQIEENWVLPDDLQFKKELIDEDKEANDKKQGKQAKSPPSGKSPSR